MAMGTFSLPWKYLFAVSDDMVIRTLGSQSTSSLHSQCSSPSSPGRPARMFTTRSRSSNSKRWGTSASLSLGPISGSSLIRENVRSMTSRNCWGESKGVDIAANRPASLALRDLEPLLAARDGLAAGHGVAQRRELARQALQPLLDGLQALADAGLAAEPRHALVEAIDAVLDALEALRDGPDPTRQALDVGRRRDVEGAHRDLLGLGRLLAGVEGAGDRPVDERVLEQVLGELAEGVLALAGQTAAQAVVGGLGHGAPSVAWRSAAPR